MSNEIQKLHDMDAIEQALVNGDLKSLSTPERVAYYRNVCESLGLNPLTKPFEYVNLNNKLQLYATKNCTDQLRTLRNVSITKLETEITDTHVIVTAHATDGTGRMDTDIGMVGKLSMNGDVANATMKAVTKAKRRVTLSLCGLGMLDETEIATIPGARVEPLEPVVAIVAPAPVERTEAENKAAALAWLLKFGERIAFSNAEQKGIVRAAKLAGFTDDDISAAKSTAEMVKAVVGALYMEMPKI